MKGLPGIILAAALVAACSKPAVDVSFIASKDAPDSLYTYALDFTDSLSSYSVSFFSRTDRPSLGGEKTVRMKLNTEWISPEGEIELKETVYMNSSPFRGSKELYRSGIRTESGIWTLNVRISGAPKGFRGLGIASERENGTR